MNISFFKKESSIFPSQIVLFITNHCNLRCRHCFIESYDSQKELSFSEVLAILDSLQRKVELIITGGEPFMRQDLLQLLKACISHKNVSNLRLTTNGLSYDKIHSIFSELLPIIHKPLFVQLSVDGLEKTHNMIRNNPLSFDSSVKCAKLFNEFDIKYSLFSYDLHFTLMQLNKDDLLPLIEFSKKNSFNFTFSLLRGSFSLFNADKKYFNTDNYESALPCSIEEINLIFKNIRKKYPFYFNYIEFRGLLIMLNTLKRKKRLFNCSAGYKDLVLYSNGNVSFCEFMLPFANIRDYKYNLSVLWNSKKSNSLRNHNKSCACIHGCNIYSSIHYERFLFNLIPRLLFNIKNLFNYGNR